MYYTYVYIRSSFHAGRVVLLISIDNLWRDGRGWGGEGQAGWLAGSVVGGSFAWESGDAGRASLSNLLPHPVFA